MGRGSCIYVYIYYLLSLDAEKLQGYVEEAYSFSERQLFPHFISTMAALRTPSSLPYRMHWGCDHLYWWSSYILLFFFLKPLTKKYKNVSTPVDRDFVRRALTRTLCFAQPNLNKWPGVRRPPCFHVTAVFLILENYSEFPPEQAAIWWLGPKRVKNNINRKSRWNSSRVLWFACYPGPQPNYFNSASFWKIPTLAWNREYESSSHSRRETEWVIVSASEGTEMHCE